MPLHLYPKLYAILCGAVSDAIDLLATPSGSLQAKLLLENALQTTEDLYINASDDGLSSAQQEAKTPITATPYTMP